jgi:DNA polymerase bacteriophage-type
MSFIFVDYETRSKKDIKLVGRDEYFAHADILMVGVIDEEREGILPSLDGYAGCTFVSWGDFDRHIAERVDGIFAPDWINAADLARMVGLPQNLKDFCSAVGIPATKDSRGTRLINKYSKLQEDGTYRVLEGEDRQAFEEYCIQDVRLLKQAWRFLSPLLKEWERCHRPGLETYEKMNARGVPIDVGAAERAQDLCIAQTRAIEAECMSRFGFKPSQVGLVRDFLGTVDASKATLEAFKTKDKDKAWLRDARLLVSPAAIKKLVPLISLASEDDRIHGAFQYHGAHTGRGTSHGVQFQNLKKSVVREGFFYDLESGSTVVDPIKETQMNIRGFIKAPEDHTFVIVDYAAVEARIVAWIAGEVGLVEAFTAGRDIYREFASSVYGVPKEQVTDSQRAHGKAAVLGCGYGMGPKKLVAQAAGQGTIISPETAKVLVDRYRKWYPAIPTLWNDIEMGVRGLIRGLSDVFVAGRCTFTINPHKTFLRIELPSQRVLRYFTPRIEKLEERDSIVYRSRFGRVACWGGSFVENICQAIAGDLKIDAMVRADKLGFRTVMEVHDELVIEEVRELSASTLTVMQLVMADPPDWMDAPGLIKGEGKISDRFTK